LYERQNAREDRALLIFADDVIEARDEVLDDLQRTGTRNGLLVLKRLEQKTDHLEMV
jgi:hypothetical protein